jgi:uncharacterized iron-regulated membrane protein
MNINLLTRKTHYWAGIVLALPLLIIVGSGLLLQVKKHWAWVQPPEQRGAATTIAVELETLLASARSVGEQGVTGWEDIKRVDIRPSRGVAKLSLENGWEIQVDLSNGAVLQSAYRRSDVIESIHDGSFFAGDITKLGVFLPTAAVLLLMLITGLWMFWLPFAYRRRRK